MTEKELSRIKNFTVFNKFGKVEYLEEVDVRNIDIDKIIQISKRKVEVYSKSTFEEHEIPKRGEGLNKKAKITINFLRPKKEESVKRYVDKLR